MPTLDAFGWAATQVADPQVALATARLLATRTIHFVDRLADAGSREDRQKTMAAFKGDLQLRAMVRLLALAARMPDAVSGRLRRLPQADDPDYKAALDLVAGVVYELRVREKQRSSSEEGSAPSPAIVEALRSDEPRGWIARLMYAVVLTRLIQSKDRGMLLAANNWLLSVAGLDTLRKGPIILHSAVAALTADVRQPSLPLLLHPLPRVSRDACVPRSRHLRRRLRLPESC